MPANKALNLCIAFAMVIFIGVLDYMTGYHLSFSVFYLIPILFAVWHIGIYSGLLVSLLSVVIYVVSDVMSGYIFPDNYILFWNAAIRFVFFIITSFLLWQVVKLRREEKETVRFVVHDLRAPVINIIMIAELMRGKCGDITESARKYLDSITLSCQRLDNLINSILDLDMLKTKSLKINRESVYIKELIDTSVQVVSVWAERSNVRLEMEYGKDSHQIETDRVLFIRILVNILSNAIKVSPSGSTVILTASCSSDRLNLSVTDNGPGFGNNVFKGIGLEFSELACKTLGGRIKFENNREGRGARVTLSFPFKCPINNEKQGVKKNDQ